MDSAGIAWIVEMVSNPDVLDHFLLARLGLEWPGNLVADDRLGILADEDPQVALPGFLIFPLLNFLGPPGVIDAGQLIPQRDGKPIEPLALANVANDLKPAARRRGREDPFRSESGNRSSQTA